jgi:O-antigen ligase
MYATIVITMVISLVYLDIPSCIFAMNSGILPKYFYYGLFVMIVPILLLKLKEFVLYLASPFSLWVFAEIIIHTLDLPDGSEVVADRIKELDQYLMLSLFFGFTFSVIRTESYEAIFRALAIIIPLLVLFDFISPGYFPTDPETSVLGRASAMYVNPTRAGHAILYIALLAIPVTPVRFRMPLLLLVGAGVIVTFSRGPIMLWMLLGLFLLLTRTIPRSSLAFPLTIIISLPLLLNSFRGYLESRQDLNSSLDNIFGRLDFFRTQSLGEDSAQERLEVLHAGWNIFFDNPIFGAGTGATTFWSHRGGTHNQIAMVAAEHGILGIALWMWLIVILWRGTYFQDSRFQQVAAVGTFLASFFSHNMLIDLYYVLTYALVSGRRVT